MRVRRVVGIRPGVNSIFRRVGFDGGLARLRDHFGALLRGVVVAFVIVVVMVLVAMILLRMRLEQIVMRMGVLRAIELGLERLRSRRMQPGFVIGLGIALLGQFTLRAMLAWGRVGDRGPTGVRALHDVALDPLAMTAAARTAMPRAPAAGAVLALLFGLAMGALFSLDQGLTIGHRNLIIVGMDFAEGEEAVAVAAVFDEGRL